MNFPIPLIPTAFLTSNGTVTPAWYKYLESLNGSRAFEIPDEFIFANDTARDDYFSANPTQLVPGIKVVSGSYFQLWDGTQWQDFTTVIQGPKGDKGDAGEAGPEGPASNTVSNEIELTWEGNVATVSDADWEAYQEFTIEYNGARFTFDKDYSDPIQTHCGTDNIVYQASMEADLHQFTITAVGSTTGNAFALTIPATQVFANSLDRSAYFNTHADELAKAPYSMVNGTVGVYTGSLVLPITYDDTKWNDGAVVIKGQDGANGTNGTNGADGAPGFSPTVTVKQNDATAYVLTVTTATGSFDTPNLLNTNLINDSATSRTTTWSSSEIASRLLGGQTWQSAVNLKTDLPTVSNGAWSPTTPAGWTPYDATKNYLVKVVGDTKENNGTYQMIAGSTQFVLFSRDTDYVDDNELAAALAGYSPLILNKTIVPAATGTATVSIAPNENVYINATSKTSGSISITHPSIAAHSGILECIATVKTGSFACPISFSNHLVVNEMTYEAAANSKYMVIFTYIEGESKWSYGIMKMA